jgi:DNA-3-methyladenine glycosylase I
MEDKNRLLPRCGWVSNSEVYRDYHDKEWGRPIHDDRLLFEFLILEGFQAGLSWLTILKRRDAFRSAFDDFDYHKIALYDEHKLAALLLDEGIIRNRLKIAASVTNAQAFINIQQESVSFDNYLWQFVDYKPIQNHFANLSRLPVSTPLSDLISKDLKKRGFRFVGSTIIYAFMQAVGMVNDHTQDCFLYPKEGK